jgi:hypothetical protein
MKLELTLAVEADPFMDEEEGILFTHTMTELGSDLHKLTSMWCMSPTEIIEKLVSDAVYKEEEENVVDGEYHPPTWVSTHSQTYLH